MRVHHEKMTDGHTVQEVMELAEKLRELRVSSWLPGEEGKGRGGGSTGGCCSWMLDLQKK